MIAILFWFFVGSVLYTYVGYPLLLALLARLRPLPQQLATPTTPTVTLLIAAYNEEDTIAAKLDNSLALDYPRDRLQILVAADGSEDGTAEIVRSYVERGSGVELSFSMPRRGKVAAINAAMPKARGEIVVLSDANNFYSPESLRELIAPFADPTVGAVTGAKRIAPGDGALGESEGLYWKYESLIRQQETRLGCCTGVAGEMLALRRELFEAPPDTIINDDFYLAMRLIRRGYRVVYAPNACSVEPVSPTAQNEVARRARIIAGRYQAIALAPRLVPLRRPLVAWQIVSHKFLRPLVPMAMAGALITNLAAVVWPVSAPNQPWYHLPPPASWILLGLQLLFYGLAWFGGRVKVESSLGRMLYLPTFLLNSNLAAVIGLFRFLTRRQTPLWQRVPRR